MPGQSGQALIEYLAVSLILVFTLLLGSEVSHILFLKWRITNIVEDYAFQIGFEELRIKRANLDDDHLESEFKSYLIKSGVVENLSSKDLKVNVYSTQKTPYGRFVRLSYCKQFFELTRGNAEYQKRDGFGRFDKKDKPFCIKIEASAFSPVLASHSIFLSGLPLESVENFAESSLRDIEKRSQSRTLKRGDFLEIK